MEWAINYLGNALLNKQTARLNLPRPQLSHFLKKWNSICFLKHRYLFKYFFYYFIDEKM